MSSATQTMPRKRNPDAPEMEMTKIEKQLLDRARRALSWVKTTLPEKDRKGYGLQNYLSDCLRGKRHLIDDYAQFAQFVKAESKNL